MHKIIPLVLLFSLSVAGCGSDSEPAAVAEEPVSTTPPVTTDPGIEECMIADLNDAVDPACLSVIFNGAVLSGVSSDGTQVIAKASRRGGGTGGTKWFDSQKTFSTPIDLVLPSQIPAFGNAGNGQKLYIKFNDQTDCAWYSHANAKYQNPRCFDGATRKPSVSSGFTGGVEVDHVRMDGVTKLTMTVNGSTGSGTLTTASATFPID